jgi:hypothetical protein
MRFVTCPAGGRYRPVDPVSTETNTLGCLEFAAWRDGLLEAVPPSRSGVATVGRRFEGVHGE